MRSLAGEADYAFGSPTRLSRQRFRYRVHLRRRPIASSDVSTRLSVRSGISRRSQSIAITQEDLDLLDEISVATSVILSRTDTKKPISLEKERDKMPEVMLWNSPFNFGCIRLGGCFAGR